MESIIGYEFEKIIDKIFESYAFENIKKEQLSQYNPLLECDLTVKKDNKLFGVVIKLYRSKLPKTDLLERACNRVQSFAINDSNVHFVLIVSSFVSPNLKDQMLQKYGVIIWDAKDLFTLTFNNTELYYGLESLLMVAFNESISDFTIINKDSDDPQKIINTLLDAKSIKTTSQLALDNKKGERLYTELLNIPTGKKSATVFEKKCTDILKYLFGDREKPNFSLWKEQKTTEGSLHRFDLVCRIDNLNALPFWKELSNDFKTRFVLFEFKNYKEKIKQGEIYTTEKYLYVTAFRTVCFIIARNDAENNAYRVAEGALRETGKLIVILSTADVKAMLDKKDSGGEPEPILSEKIDKLLVELTR